MILAYSLAIYVVMSVTSVLLIADRCLLYNVCSAGENLSLTLLTTGWLATTAWVIVRGWRGRLPGCRSRSPLSF